MCTPPLARRLADMIQIQNLTKDFGSRTVVDNLSFEVRPGVVTGFLGPNGAGKSTTMRMILGLDRPTSGQALIDGVRYRDLPRPLTMVGALLDARWVHGQRSARAHLAWLAASNDLPRGRVDEVLDLVLSLIHISEPTRLGMISYAAMDFRDAQDELEWARPNLRATAAAVRLGHVRDVDDAVEARAILDQLAAAALDRAAALAEVELDLSDQAALSRVMARLITGRAKVTGRWA